LQKFDVQINRRNVHDHKGTNIISAFGLAQQMSLKLSNDDELERSHRHWHYRRSTRFFWL